MKQLMIIAAIAFLMVACKKEGASDRPGMETIDTTSAVLKYSGSFGSGPYGTARGDAKVYEQSGKLVLVIDNFSVNNGPDLYVYLSREMQPVNFISLGKLRSTSGKQVYDIPGRPDFSQYRFALIHCQQFNHLFGSAELK
ncbi:MAG TPA: DM13 domain-containing protein [Chitinophagaceae bacterium]